MFLLARKITHNVLRSFQAYEKRNRTKISENRLGIRTHLPGDRDILVRIENFGNFNVHILEGI